MRIFVVSVAAPHPIGGAIVPYEHANHLARLGHEVVVGHAADPPIRSVADLSWFTFDERVGHRFEVRSSGVAGPVGDVVLGSHHLPRQLGLPSTYVQGALATDIEQIHLIDDHWTSNGPVFCVSRFMADQCLAAGVPAHRVIHAPNGLRHDLFAVRTPPPDRDLVVGMLVGPAGTKGLELGLEVLAAARARVPGLRAVLFGPTDHPEPWPDWIEYLGVVHQDDLGAVYNRCRAFLCPAGREGFGNTGLEAMACGAALVTTDTGGSRDFADHGRTAMVSEAHDPDELADHLVAVLGDDDLRLGLVARALEVVPRFDWAATASVIEHVLDDYLARPGRYDDGAIGPSLPWLGDGPGAVPGLAAPVPGSTPTSCEATIGVQTVRVATFDDPWSAATTSAVLSGAAYPRLPWIDDVQVVVDVGAGVGAATVRFAREHPRAIVHALEPSASTAALLDVNTAAELNVVRHRTFLVPEVGPAALFPGETPLQAASPAPVGEFLGRTWCDGTDVTWWFDQLHRPVGIVKVNTGPGGVDLLEALGPRLVDVSVIHVEWYSPGDDGRLRSLLGRTHDELFGARRAGRGSSTYVRRDRWPTPYQRQRALPAFEGLCSVEAAVRWDGASPVGSWLLPGPGV